MRSVILGVSLCFLAGCATVSMVSGETTVETGLTQDQSELRTASAAYCDETVEEGWVNASGGLFGLANTLINGESETEKPADYATRVEAATAAPVIVLARIMSDSEAARTGLAAVTSEAVRVLNSPTETKTSRSDVMSFERALVRAQLSHRSFQEALSVVAVRADMGVGPVDAELETFADTIDEARKVADGLADKYASLNTSVS